MVRSLKLTHYQRGHRHSAQYRGFKLATSMFVLSYLYLHLLLHGITRS